MPEEQSTRTSHLDRAFIWLTLTFVRVAAVFAYAASSVSPWGPPAFGPDAPPFAKLLDPRVSHREVFEDNE